MMGMNLEGIFLDLDGTLINSEKAFSECFINILCDKFKAQVTREDYKKYELDHNNMLIDYIRRTSNVLDNILDEEIMQLVYTNYVEYFKNVIKEPEAVSNFELISDLRKRGYVLALVTI